MFLTFKKNQSNLFRALFLPLVALTQGSLYADNNTLQMESDFSAYYYSPAVSVSTSCTAGNYTVRLDNLNYDVQACNLHCKHIISKETFLVFVQPYSPVVLVGNFPHAKCDVTCTSQTHGLSSSFSIEQRC